MASTSFWDSLFSHWNHPKSISNPGWTKTAGSLTSRCDVIATGAGNLVSAEFVCSISMHISHDQLQLQWMPGIHGSSRNPPPHQPTTRSAESLHRYGRPEKESPSWSHPPMGVEDSRGQLSSQEPVISPCGSSTCFSQVLDFALALSPACWVLPAFQLAHLVDKRGFNSSELHHFIRCVPVSAIVAIEPTATQPAPFRRPVERNGSIVVQDRRGRGCAGRPGELSLLMVESSSWPVVISGD